jgi:double-strand break repair protein MRE11
MNTLSLKDVPNLDPDHPKCDAKVSQVLQEKVEVLIHDAREKYQELLQAARTEGNVLAKFFMEGHPAHGKSPLKNVIQKEDEVLVRLKVDHTGFAAMNNQRFGAKFVGQVANPVSTCSYAHILLSWRIMACNEVILIFYCSHSLTKIMQTDILLFHRKRAESGPKSKPTKEIKPIEPSEIGEIDIIDILVEELESTDTKMEILDKKETVAAALDAYVDKQQAQAINEAFDKILSKKQKKLIREGAEGLHAKGDADEEGDREKENKGSSRKTKRKKRSEQDDEDDFGDGDEDMEDDPPASSRSRSTAKASKGSRSKSSRKSDDEDEDDFDSDDVEMSAAPKSKSISKASSRTTTGRSRKPVKYTEDSDDDEIEAIDPPPKSRKTGGKTGGKASKRAVDRSMDDSDSDDVEIIDDPPPKKKAARGRAPSTSSKGGRGKSSGLTQSQLSFQPVSNKSKTSAAKSSRKKKYADDDSDDEDFTLSSRKHDVDDDDWGTAKSNSTF